MIPSQNKLLELWLSATAARFLTGDTETLCSRDWNQIKSPSFPALSRNEIVLARRDGDPESMIDSALRDFAGAPFKWCVSPFCCPTDLGQRLLRRGFRSWEARVMTCSTSQSKAVADIPIEEVREDSLIEFAQCFCEGWSIEEKYQSRVFADLKWSLETGRFRYFLGRDKGRAVATAGLVLTPVGGYLMGAQVIEQARGQGLYRALIRARLGALAAMGVEQACTQAREASSAPILESLGFETAIHFRCFAKDSC
ncbi:MAG: hypothetical protein P1V97_06220 [Planctomycetota bacterium]|nr:hypothetical protein [Planctomycetota bacterium]